jgi:hypothetical protein
VRVIKGGLELSTLSRIAEKADAAGEFARQA